MTDQPWADVVVDLRSARHTRLPSHDFKGRRKVTVDGVNIAGSRLDVGTGIDLRIIKWTDQTGFTGGVMHDQRPPHGSSTQTQDVLPHLRHLTSANPPAKWKNQTVPQQGGLAVFAAATPGLRHILTDGTISQPVPGAADSRAALMYRLAWAGVGVPDIRQVPPALRDWDLSARFPGDGSDSLDWWPEDLTTRGPQVVAAWQQAGFDAFEPIAEWVQMLHGDILEAYSACRSKQQLENLATWYQAGFTAEETVEWFSAARYDRSDFRARFVPAHVCAQLRREYGLTPEHLAHLTVDVSPDATPSAVTQHVKTWLNASPDPDRVCLYLAAGMTKAEARAHERSAEPPSDEQLRFLAAMRGGQPVL